jgi:hypothetical protein
MLVPRLARPPSVMIDPSLLFAANGSDWLRLNREAEVEVVVPRIVAEWLDGAGDLEPSLLLAPEDVEMLDPRLEEIRELASEGLRVIDHREISLDAISNETIERLHESGDPAADVWADEWAYLQTSSWLTAKLRRCLDAFEAAGVAIVEFGQEVGVELIEEVIPARHLPQSINRSVILKATVKWVVVGGAHALGGTVGAVAGSAAGGPVGAVIGEKLAGYAAGDATKRALLAIDP